MTTTQFNTELKNLLTSSDNITFENMTPEQFKVKLEAQRVRTAPSFEKKLKRNDGIKVKDSVTGSVIYRPTYDQYYRVFINDVLKNIQSGGFDYCFKWYQIKELLRFHKYTLQCEMVRESSGAHDIYFIVSLLENWQEIEKNILPEPTVEN